MRQEKKPFHFLKGLFFLLCLGLAGCGHSPPKEARIFCAASLQPLVTKALQELQIEASLQSAGSRTLVTQVQAGAEADLLLLADPELQSELGGEHQTHTFAGNSLVLAKRVGSPQTPSLSQSDTALALADPATAPLGRYSLQALAQYQTACRRVTLKNSSAVVTALRLGHTDLGVVYASELQTAPELQVVEEFSPESHDPIRYSAVLLHPEQAEAARLFEFLTSDKAKALLEEQGLQSLR